jgi:hypothetical protein
MSEEEKGIDVALETASNDEKAAPEVVVGDAEVEAQEKSAEKAEISPEEGISELKKSLEREKQARLEAERRALEAQSKAQKANADKSESDYQLVLNAIDSLKMRTEQLKAAYADAMNTQDYARAAEVQAEMNIGAHQLSELKRGEKAMKAQMEEAERNPPPVIPQGDLVDRLASQVSARSAAWLRESRDHLRTERDVRKMFRAHEDAIDDGIEPDSAEYFQFIEQRLGIRRNADEASTRTTAESPMSAAAAPRKPVQPPPAPVSRGGQRSNVMRLSAAEAETAKSLGMTVEEYARNKALLKEEGRYGH